MVGGDKLIKVVSLFSGIGGFEVGIMDALESVNISMSSEIDKYAAEAYEMYFNHKPEGDITKIESKDIPNHDVLVAGFPCFRAGTLITTDKGLVSIEEIKQGDLVLTHKNRFKKVLEIKSVPSLV